ncbi:hypothetical protein B0H13DRAFT_2340540 [Mycena leptocephala]|nr:hypothetical protein B0H13DRAFT_2340540 [Mycena leptocephala]
MTEMQVSADNAPPAPTHLVVDAPAWPKILYGGDGEIKLAANTIKDSKHVLPSVGPRPPLPLLDKQNFQKAAYTFLRLGSTKDFGDWMGKVPPAFLSPRHLRVLCALAILLCPALKTQIFENSTFGVYVELAPYVRELVGAHLSRTFKAVELLNRYSWRHALDIYLAPRVTELINMIRNWVVVPYFQPFAEDGASRRSRSGSSRSSSPTPFTSASTIRTMCLLYFILKPYMQLNTSPGRRFCTRRAPQAARRPPGRAHVADGSRIAVEGCLVARSTICAMSRSLPPRINRQSWLKDDGEDLIYLL